MLVHLKVVSLFIILATTPNAFAFPLPGPVNAQNNGNSGSNFHDNSSSGGSFGSSSSGHRAANSASFSEARSSSSASSTTALSDVAALSSTSLSETANDASAVAAAAAAAAAAGSQGSLLHSTVYQAHNLLNPSTATTTTSSSSETTSHSHHHGKSRGHHHHRHHSNTAGMRGKSKHQHQQHQHHHHQSYQNSNLRYAHEHDRDGHDNNEDEDEEIADDQSDCKGHHLRMQRLLWSLQDLSININVDLPILLAMPKKLVPSISWPELPPSLLQKEASELSLPPLENLESPESTDVSSNPFHDDRSKHEDNTLSTKKSSSLNELHVQHPRSVWRKLKKLLGVMFKGSRTNKVGVCSTPLHTEAWLEALDKKHRYGPYLAEYHDHWRKSSTAQSFFEWLDNGDGANMSLPSTPRSRLESSQVEYNAMLTETDHYKGQDHHPKSVFSTTASTTAGHVNKKPTASVPSSHVGDSRHDNRAMMFEATVKDGKLVSAVTGEPVDTPRHHAMFAYTTDEKFYIGRKIEGRFHHSSLAAGKPVFAAGEIYAVDGVLGEINLWSGHYRTSRAGLDAAVQRLRELGLSIPESKINYELPEDENEENELHEIDADDNNDDGKDAHSDFFSDEGEASDDENDDNDDESDDGDCRHDDNSDDNESDSGFDVEFVE